MTDQATPVEANTQATNQAAPAAVNPASEQTTSLFDQMVGEGKKFRNAESLAFGKLNADQHIENLTQELKELREKNAALEAENKNRKDMETILEDLRNMKMTYSENATLSGVEPPTTVDVDSIVKRVKSEFDAESKAEVARKNATEAEQVLRNEFGQDYQNVVAKKVQELGLPLEAFVSTMATSPKAAFALLGINNKTATTPSVAPNTINTSASLGQGLTPRQARIAEIRALKQTNFHKYLDAQGELNKLLVQERLGN